MDICKLFNCHFWLKIIMPGKFGISYNVIILFQVKYFYA